MFMELVEFIFDYREEVYPLMKEKGHLANTGWPFGG
jgi:hypothetical protein